IRIGRRSSVASITLLTRTETQLFPSPATDLTSLSRVSFEALARPVRRVSCSTIYLGGAWRKFSQSANALRSFCASRPKRRYFSSSKMRIPAKGEGNPHASSKPPARETDANEQAALTRNEPRERAAGNGLPVVSGEFRYCQPGCR